jgi:rod shape-determining protein MreD
VINMIPLGRLAWMPDLLAVVLVFWRAPAAPRGRAWAFFGLAMDVHDGALLGQHALAYSAAELRAIMLHRRLLWFALAGQAVQVLPLFFAAHVITLVVLAGGRHVAGLEPAAGAAAVAAGCLLLLAPQRVRRTRCAAPGPTVLLLPALLAPGRARQIRPARDQPAGRPALERRGPDARGH